VVFMVWFVNNIRATLWVAVVPAFVAVALLVFGVHDPDRAGNNREARSALTFAGTMCLPLRYWLVVLVGAVFALARFSEAFLVLRAQDVGLTLAYVPLVLIVMNVVYTATAYPAGVAADHISGLSLLIVGLAMLILSDLVLAASASPLQAFIGAAFWGLHLGLTQGLFSKLVADTAPAELRGTAFGIFNLVSGGALLLASLVAGALWSAFGASATFLTGAAFAMLAVFGLVAYRKKPQPHEK
jgi:predicted MFS family arabinose efflux permease